MIIRPNYLKAISPFVIAIVLWSLAVLMPPQSSPIFITFEILIPSLIPIGILITLINTKIVLSNDGYLTVEVFGIKKHSFKKEDVNSVKENYLFRNVRGGLGMGKALYIKYSNSNPRIQKELSISYSVYRQNDIKSIQDFINFRESK